MNFNSWQFLLYLPIVLLGYWLLPKKIKWVWLLLASYYFYMSWDVWPVFLIFGATLLSYAMALGIEKVTSKGWKKFLLFLTLFLSLGLLAFFKYANFLIENVIAFLSLFALQLPKTTLSLILPVGISFYTFQALSYVVDVYRGRIKAERHFGYYALYVSFFPQLVAGPIERAEDLLPQLKESHPFSKDDFFAGLRYLLVGFFRKCVIADTMGIYVDNAFKGIATASSFEVFLAGALFCFQMYSDFAGYSEIAMGSARMMGVHLTKNFDQPYLSTSYSEFFRRWHITLNRWFTDYVYIPLGGSRKGLFKKILNVFVVFLLCGLWHGPRWTYVLWGAYAAFFVSLESLLRKPFLAFMARKKIDLSSPYVLLFRRAYMFLIFVPAALLFRSASLSEAGVALGRLFTAWGFGSAYFSDSLSAMGLPFGVLLIFALSLVAITLLYPFENEGIPALAIEKGFSKKEMDSLAARRISVYGLSIAAIALCWIALLTNGGASAFAYFQF